MVRAVAKGRGRPKPSAGNYHRPAIIHATLEHRDSNSSICFQFGQYGSESEYPPNPRGTKSIAWQIGVAALYIIVGGAVLRTLYYQYQINELSAEMVDATSLRQANLDRLDKVRKEMGMLSGELHELKEKNTGLRKEQKDREEERMQSQEGNGAASSRGHLSSEEMGNI